MQKTPKQGTGAGRNAPEQRRRSDGSSAAAAGKGILGRFLLSAVGGGLVYLAFPPADFWPLSYVALAPVFFSACRSPSWKGAALCGAAAGLVAYLPAFAWLASVSVAGWVFLSIYVATYMTAAAVLVRHLGRRYPRGWPVLAACAWVGLELIRANFATGFPWLLYGHTQHRFTALIQLAALTGAYGVSFLVVWVNASLAAAALSFQRRDAHGGQPRRRWALVNVGAALGLVSICAVAGARLAAGMELKEGPVVGVVQQNIPRLVSEIGMPPEVAEALAQLELEAEGMDESTRERLAREVMAYYDGIYANMRREIEKTAALSERLVGEGVRLLVWPETTVQVPLNIAPSLNPDARSAAVQEFAFQTLRRLGRSMDAHLLVGAPSWFPRSAGFVERVYYDTTVRHFANSALMFSPDGEFLQRYDKMHLVPFGEYVPGRDWLPVLGKLTPMTRDVTPGETPVIFELPVGSGETVRFAALICYEDVMPSLVRQFRRGGAQFLVNLTDEGWYRIPGELTQHAAMAVFRAVETRLTVVRAANTGISCFINPRGEIYRVVKQEVGGRTRLCEVEGSAAAPVLLCDSVTPYVRLGDWFGWGCLLVLIFLCAAGGLLSRRRKRPRDKGTN